MKPTKFRKLYRRIINGKIDANELSKLLPSDFLTNDQFNQLQSAIAMGIIGIVAEKANEAQLDEPEYSQHPKRISKRFISTGADMQSVKESVGEFIKERDVTYPYSWDAFLQNTFDVFNDIRKGKTPKGIALSDPRYEKEWIILIANEYLRNLYTFEENLMNSSI
jgi:hypothetical protein